jgi:hypothetical protein
MYWKGREWFEGMNVECADVEIGAELGDVTYGYTSAGQIKVEPKDAIKERLGRSPDVGESLLLSLMEDCQRSPRTAVGRMGRRARVRCGKRVGGGMARSARRPADVADLTETAV